MSESCNKQNLIMINIQKLRNEIEDIRKQNLSMLEALKPYENWYENAEQILFSSSNSNRKIKSTKKKILAFQKYFDSSSSLSSDDNNSEYSTNKRNTSNDSEYQDKPNLFHNTEKSNKRTQNISKNPLHKTNKINLTTNNNLNSQNQLQLYTNIIDLPSNNYNPPNISYQQDINKDDEFSIGNYTPVNHQYTQNSNQLSLINSPNQINNQANIYSFTQNQNNYHTISKVSQIGTNSMLSNAIIKERLNLQNKNSAINIQSTNTYNNTSPYFKPYIQQEINNSSIPSNNIHTRLVSTNQNLIGNNNPAQTNLNETKSTQVNSFNRIPLCRSYAPPKSHTINISGNYSKSILPDHDHIYMPPPEKEGKTNRNNSNLYYNLYTNIIQTNQNASESCFNHGAPKETNNEYDIVNDFSIENMHIPDFYMSGDINNQKQNENDKQINREFNENDSFTPKFSIHMK